MIKNRWIVGSDLYRLNNVPTNSNHLINILFYHKGCVTASGRRQRSSGFTQTLIRIRARSCNSFLRMLHVSMQLASQGRVISHELHHHRRMSQPITETRTISSPSLNSPDTVMQQLHVDSKCLKVVPHICGFPPSLGKANSPKAPRVTFKPQT